MRRKPPAYRSLSGRIAVTVTIVSSLATAGVACSSGQPPASGSLGGAPDGGAYTRSDAANIDDEGGGPGGDASADDALDAADSGPPCLSDALVADGGDGVCPAAGACSAACEDIKANYRGGVAQAAVACIAALPGCEIGADVIPCVDQALARACADPTSSGYCASFVTACDPNAGDAGSAISQAGCEMFANGLSEAGRTAFKACADEKIGAGTCPAEIVLCADEIRQ